MLKARLNLESLDGRFVPDATQPALVTEPPSVVTTQPPTDPQTSPPATDPGDPAPPPDGPQLADPPKLPPPPTVPGTTPKPPPVEEVPPLPPLFVDINLPVDVKDKVVKLYAQIQSLQKENVKLADDLKIADVKVQQQVDAIKTVESNRDTALVKLRVAIKEKNQDDINKAQGEVDGLNAAVNALNDTLTKLRADLKAITDKIAANNQKIESLWAEIGKLVAPYILDKGK